MDGRVVFALFGAVPHAPRVRLRIVSLSLALLAVLPTVATAKPADRADAAAAFAAVGSDLSVASGWTGAVDTCTLGTESDASLTATRHAVNTLRDFAGLAPVEFDPALNHKALAAALIMLANDDLSHDPPPSWKCWTQEGHDAAAQSNLFLGKFGADAMVGFVADDGVSNLGHRRWVLNQPAQTMGSGSTTKTNALYVFGRSGPSVSGRVSSWPPAGYVPWDWVFKDWSLNVDGDPASSVDIANATVAVSAGGQPLAVSAVTPLDPGFGSGQTLKWNVAVPAGLMSSDASLTVTVNGVTVSGNPLPITYTVQAFRGPATEKTAATTTAAPAPVFKSVSPSFTRSPSVSRADGKGSKPLRVGTRVKAATLIRNAAKVTYQWRRNGRAIRRATKVNYTVKLADRGKRLSVTVTATSKDGVRRARTSPGRLVF